MKKIIAFIAAGMLLAAAAGCSGNNAEPVVTTAAVTGVAGSDSVLEYIGRNAPNFSAYISERRIIPITFETTINAGSGAYKTAFYIKDENTFAHSSVSPDGTTVRAVFKDGKRYDIFSDEKKVYYTKCEGKELEKAFKPFVMEIYEEDMIGCTFSNDEQELDGVQYIHEQIVSPVKNAEGETTGEQISDYYFDKETGKLRYIAAAGNKTEITVFEHTVDNKMFDIPKDYEMVDYQSYYDQFVGGNKS